VICSEPGLGSGPSANYRDVNRGAARL